MEHPDVPIPGVTDDPVIRLLLSGEAKTLYEAEERYLDSALPEIYELLASPLSSQELLEHPLMQMLLKHSRPRREDLVEETALPIPLYVPCPRHPQ